MLEVSHLSRKYGNFVAVDDVSFAIQPGEIVGLLGHNGAGKTTIMKMLSGFLEPDKGQICINDIDLATQLKTVQQGLGYLPENLPVYPDLSVVDYLDYAATLKGISQESRLSEVKRVVKATDIQSKILNPIATLSRGYKQRVGVAQALLGQPSLLILDEPTNGLDPTQTESMRDLIKTIAQHATVILSTHIMQEVDAICDRVLILSGGRLAVDAQMDELQRSNHLLLTTNLKPEEAESLLTNQDGVSAINQIEAEHEHIANSFSYRIEITQNNDMDKVSANLAKVIVPTGADLFSLQPEKRSLETLFREVTTAGNTTNSKRIEGGIAHAS